MLIRCPYNIDRKNIYGRMILNVSEKIVQLRARAHMTQAACAEELGVTRQAIQKWESGAVVPELENLIRLSRMFGVSLDELVGCGNRRNAEILYQQSKISPDYSQMNVWDSYAEDLRTEYRQALEEGKDVETYRELFDSVANMPSGLEKKEIADILFNMVMKAPMRADYTYNEPSDLEGIRLLRRGETPKLPLPDRAELEDRLLGAWLGRICGCLLGKPVETWKRAQLQPMLKASGNWPMHRYIRSSDVAEDQKNKCWADTVDCMPVDDDTNYTVLAGVLLDKYGRDFTPENVASVWMDYQPRRAYCTAERVAYTNFMRGYMPPNSAVYHNPYREWIGAQIRGDYYGYINPGDPETAADMAFRDASISHIKNGIYGEMFVSAMLAQAAVERNMEQVIRAGLAQIPAGSRLHEAVCAVIDGWKKGVSAEVCFIEIHKRFDENELHDWCHVISNAMVVTAALLYGEGDYGKTVCLAVHTGFDTDCNAATAGSVLGMMRGSAAIGPEWTGPVHGQLDTSIFGVGKVSVADMVRKTMTHLPKGLYAE